MPKAVESGKRAARPAKARRAKAPPSRRGGSAAESLGARGEPARALPTPSAPPVSSPSNGINTIRASADQRGKYVYCVIHSEKPLTFGPIGIGAEPTEVHTVNFRDLGAVVSDTPIELYEPTRQNVLAHERVNETVMRNHTVIPMSFGTVFKTREDIHQLLRSAYDAFKDRSEEHTSE